MKNPVSLEVVLLLLVAVTLFSTGHTQSVYLTLGSTNITTNNTEVLITDIGEDVEGGLTSLTCHTDLTECCRAGDTPDGQGGVGEWYYPDGRVVPNSAAGEGFYRVRNAPQVVRLARRTSSNTLSPTGSYCCVIPTTGGEMTFCANIVVCPSLSLTNGMISYSDLTLGVDSVATHTCDSGYTFNGGSTRTCRSDGTWSGSDPTCEVVCPMGTYREDLSTRKTACVPCPGNSFSTANDSRECACFSGYYRTELEGPNHPCSAPPSSCRNLHVFEERTRANTITVRWERPEITGRDDFYYNIFYSEDNQTFTQHNTRQYAKRSLLVDYSLSGLRPLTSYTIRVTAENGVSDQEERGETRSCEVAGRTGDIRSNALSLVIGFCSVVVWTTPTRSYGRITGYDVRFVSPGSDEMVVSKGSRELFHAIRDEMTNTRNVTVQVRAQTLTAAGRWSDLVPLGCLSEGSSPDSIG